jgi:hypothetical protein
VFFTKLSEVLLERTIGLHLASSKYLKISASLLIDTQAGLNVCAGSVTDYKVVEGGPYRQ